MGTRRFRDVGKFYEHPPAAQSLAEGANTGSGSTEIHADPAGSGVARLLWQRDRAVQVAVQCNTVSQPNKTHSSPATVRVTDLTEDVELGAFDHQSKGLRRRRSVSEPQKCASVRDVLDDARQADLAWQDSIRFHVALAPAELTAIRR